MMRFFVATAAVLALATAGCSRSPRVTFYTLVPAATAGVPAPVSGVPSVAVGPVSLPEMVDRPQFVVREGANRVEILEAQRWAEPLKTGIPRFVAEELGRRLGSTRVSSYQQFSGAAADYRVLMDILRFESVPGQSVTVEVNWTVRSSSPAPATGHSLVREKIQVPGYEAMVAAYGRALSRVSDDVAKALRAEMAVKP